MVARYVALLRGINVGGRNIVPMADLRAAFEADGYGAVRSYIQSGNVLFETTQPAKGLEAALEGMLERRLGHTILVVVRSLAQLRATVASAPAGFGDEPDAYKYDVMFLKAPLTAGEVIEVLDPRDGVDRVWPGRDAVYFSRDATQLTRSRMSKIASTPVYQRMTVRNWRTTTRLLEMLDEA